MKEWNPKRAFSRVGIGLCAMLVVVFIVQYLWFEIPDWVLGPENRLTVSSAWMWLGNIVPMYLLGMPVFLLVVRKVPAQSGPKEPLGANRFWILLPICFFFMYSGNIIGNLLSAILSGGTAVNPIEDVLMDNHPLKFLMTVILAPVFEEYIFRRQIIDKLRGYGEKTAVLISALLFGLFHLNLYQFVYAFGLGILFGYMYVRSGRLRYSVIVHMLINFIGGVIAPAMLQLLENPIFANPDSMDMMQSLFSLPLLLLLEVFSAAIFGMFVAGLVLFCVRFKKAEWLPASAQLPKEQVHQSIWNVGMVLFIILSTGLTIVMLYL